MKNLNEGKNVAAAGAGWSSSRRKGFASSECCSRRSDELCEQILDAHPLLLHLLGHHIDLVAQVLRFTALLERAQQGAPQKSLGAALDPGAMFRKHRHNVAVLVCFCEKSSSGINIACSHQQLHGWFQWLMNAHPQLLCSGVCLSPKHT